MALKKEENEQFYVDHARKIVNEVDTTFKYISVFSTQEDMKSAQNSISVKKLIKEFGYKIQMAIK